MFWNVSACRSLTQLSALALVALSNATVWGYSSFQQLWFNHLITKCATLLVTIKVLHIITHSSLTFLVTNKLSSIAIVPGSNTGLWSITLWTHTISNMCRRFRAPFWSIYPKDKTINMIVYCLRPATCYFLQAKNRIDNNIFQPLLTCPCGEPPV